MCAHEFTEPRSAVSRIESVLTWLGGGHWHELGERHERSTHAITGAVVALGAVLAWLVATVAVSESAHLPVLAVVALTLVFGLLVGAVTRGTASGPARGWPGIAGRAAVAVALGVVVGELAALVVFSGSIEHRLDQRALRTADSAPAVAQASESLQQTRDARGALDNAVEQARDQQDKALVVARCEYNPTPACPQTRITGVPGTGPETRTANQLLADAQHALDNALATRDRQAPELDAKISAEQRSLTQARQSVIAEADRGLGARWVAMNDLTLAIGAQVLRLLTIAFFTLLYLLPLILLRWRGETTHDRHSTARADHQRAELEADTAIAIKRAEVRRETEIMWAEHQLTHARLTIEAQAEIDREQQRRRVIEALDGPVATSSQRTFEPVAPGMYLPIAAEAEAAGRAVAQLPAGAQDARVETAENLPAQIQPNDATEPHHEHATPLIPRWIRPLVPPFVARVIDNTTQPLRTARHVFGEVFEEVFEEVEEITFALKRTRRVTVSSGSSDTSDQPPLASGDAKIPESSSPANRVESSRSQASAYEEYSSLGRAPTKDVGGLSLGSAERDSLLELMEREGTRELRSPEGPRQLPPAE
jgi:Domain of unknown function (DUF4407)